MIKGKIKKTLVNPQILPNEFWDLLIVQSVKISGLIVIPITLLIAFLFITSIFLNRPIILDINKVTSLKDVISFFSIPVIFFLGVLPVLYKKVYEKESLYNIGLVYGRNRIYIFWMLVSFAILLASILSIYRIEQTLFFILVLHNFAVGLSEEILVRGVILTELKKIFNVYSSIVIDALIFAFVFHANEDIKINLFIRFPLGLILALIATRAKSIHPCVLLHWAYNAAVALI
ncbi:CPBP family intramembrane glutamic endopeptidase [Thermoanaerobacter mathranii]|uniref:CPBP family intramembrane glutamic endopeptidase n=1 Tax=Thermoanaerobacter mathranii TaxID=583357 RepID=UPI003D6A9FC6